MITTLSATLLTLLLTGPQVSDTTITVAAGTRLNVHTQGGEIVVDTWERNEVRIQAEHGSRDFIRVARSGDVVQVRADARRGAPGIVDYRITVPAGMDLDLQGLYADIAVTGSRGQVQARTVNGDIRVTGGSGQVVGESVQGDVTIQSSRAAVRARSVAGRVRVRDVTGTIDAETVSGGVVLERVESAQVDASAVSGGIYFDGSIMENGRYRFVSHSGQVTIAVPGAPNATMTVATLSGSVRSSFAGVVSSSNRRGSRESFVLGSGSASIEAESFSGDVRIVSRGEVRPPN